MEARMVQPGCNIQVWTMETVHASAFPQLWWRKAGSRPAALHSHPYLLCIVLTVPKHEKDIYSSVGTAPESSYIKDCEFYCSRDRFYHWVTKKQIIIFLISIQWVTLATARASCYQQAGCDGGRWVVLPRTLADTFRGWNASSFLSSKQLFCIFPLGSH